MINTFSEITLDEVLQRPEAYLPARSIYALKAFIDGVNCPDQTDVWDYLDGFYEWLLETFEHEGKTGLPCEMKLIMHYMSRDAHEAYDTFFELLQAFRLDEPELPLFKALRERPYDFLPEKSIYTLYAYLWGKDTVAQGLIEPIALAGFEAYIEEHYEMKGAWHKLILLHTQDEFGALNVFRELYEAFTANPEHATDSFGNSALDAAH
jgi:hypothetical protein